MLNDDHVRAELERIGVNILYLWDQYMGVHDSTVRYIHLGKLREALRLLAESQQALGVLADGQRKDLITYAEKNNIKIKDKDNFFRDDNNNADDARYYYPALLDLISSIARNAVKGGKL